MAMVRRSNQSGIIVRQGPFFRCPIKYGGVDGKRLEMLPLHWYHHSSVPRKYGC